MEMLFTTLVQIYMATVGFFCCLCNVLYFNYKFIYCISKLEYHLECKSKWILICWIEVYCGLGCVLPIRIKTIECIFFFLWLIQEFWRKKAFIFWYQNALISYLICDKHLYWILIWCINLFHDILMRINNLHIVYRLLKKIDFISIERRQLHHNLLI